MQLRRVCVFTGSRPGVKPQYGEAAIALGRELARRDIGLVFGGGSVGLMGVLADGVLAAGGEVVGVIPEALALREVAHAGVTTMHVVTTMHERKALMADLSDAFVAMPGGFGTFEELFEITTWSQLGIHTKPVGLLNVDRFFDPLIALVEHAVAEGFVVPDHARLLLTKTEPAAMLDAIETWQRPGLGPKWITRTEI